MNNYIAHHGIKGQRWGIRRYQNEDGSLTSAGKKRINLSNENLSNAKKVADSTATLTDKAKRVNDTIGDIRRNSKVRHDLNKMSDRDLQDVVKRMNLEQQYSDLKSKQISKGKVNVGNVLEIAGSTLGIASSAIAIALSIREFKK